MSVGAKSLLGKRVLLVTVDQEQLNLQLDGATLNILNPVVLQGIGNDPGALVGRSVQAVEHMSDYLEIRFTGGATVRIDLRDSAYEGPEAAVLTVGGGPTIVW